MARPGNKRGGPRVPTNPLGLTGRVRNEVGVAREKLFCDFLRMPQVIAEKSLTRDRRLTAHSARLG
jgi:hypothetical protein